MCFDIFFWSYRAEAYLAEDFYDEAVNDYRRALELDEGYGRAKEGLETAKKRQKQASKRDYYKILGLKRNCNKKEVNKAYRKLAQKWHPDNFQDETEKKSAEKKFMDIAAAKEVLTDPEMRQKFDRGEDPMDAEEQQNSRNNPFHGFHHPGQGGPGGGFQFKFHFNWNDQICYTFKFFHTFFVCYILYVNTIFVIFSKLAQL